MYNSLFFALVGILLADFLFDRILDLLNAKRMHDVIPDALQDVYEAGQYKKQQEYRHANDRLSAVTASFNLMVILAMLFAGGFHVADSIARGFSSNPVVIALIFFGLLALAADILNTPFGVYDTFVIENRFGFNTTTPRLYVADKIKGWALGAIIGGALLAAIVWFYQVAGANFWIFAWLLATGFSLFMAMFYSRLIVPLFNRQTALEPGELRSAIEEFVARCQFSLENIYVIDGSRRSTRSNAYFTGLGRQKRIVLYDTLIKDLATPEIVAVLAHEIGHYKKQHIWTGLLAGTIQTGVTLFILSLFVHHPALSKVLGSEEPGFHLALVAFGILYSPISLVTSLLMNLISRKNEFMADRFAREFGLAQPLIAALKKLASKNYSNLTPHPLYVLFHYSHPTLLQRIHALHPDKG